MASLLPYLISASLLVSVHSAPVLTPTPAPASSSAGAGSLSPTALPRSASPSHTPGYILLDWDTATPTSAAYLAPSATGAGTTSSVLLHPAAAASSAVANDVPTQTKASWALPPTFSNMDPFHITSYAAGAQNIAVLRGSPVKWSNTTLNAADSSEAGGDHSHAEKWEMGQNALQILYPNGTINPGNKPQGGAEFYGQPLDLRQATNTSLQYSVYFPHDFEFVKGGKLPGLYGGHKGCSGGNAAEDCFSTRIMWRAGGKGELYLYVPKDKQTSSLCSTPPNSVCDSEYGLSIGRGAWTFAQGDWTTIRQDVWLNTPGVNDGGFNIWINGQLVMTANDVRYRENALACTDSISAAAVPVNNEDWSSMEADSVDGMSMSSTAMSAVPSASASPRSMAGRRASRPMFQTPMRRWMERDEAGDQQPMGGDGDFTAAGFASAVASAASPAQSADMSSMAADDADPLPEMADPASGLPTTDGPMSSDPSVNDGTMASDPTASPLDPSSDVGSGTDAASPASDDISSASASASPSMAPSATSSPLLTQSNDSDNMTMSAEEQAAACGVGFIGLFFSTFFGGHTTDWATPKDQYTYYKDFEMWVSN